jgi:hypothetical protein
VKRVQSRYVPAKKTIHLLWVDLPVDWREGKRTMSNKDRVVALAFLGIGLLALVKGYEHPFGTVSNPQAAFFPVLLSILLMILSLILLARSLRSKVANQKRVYLWDEWKKIIPAAAGIGAYVFLLKPLGYLMCTFLLITLISKLVNCSWKLSLLVSILSTFLSYCIFRWYLQSPLPQGIIPL